jgi:hypothetical protein
MRVAWSSIGALTAMALKGPVVLDGIVSDEKLAELLALGTEYAELDFKRVIDLRDKRQEVELARDVGGMLVRGGYILAGIGPDARPTDDMDSMDVALFDDARLVPKLRTWLPEPLSLVTRVTEREGHKVVLIYVERSPAGVAFMRADGTHLKGSDTQFLFHKGDAFWRNGSRTERLGGQGHEEIIQRRIEDAKAAWMTEQREMRRHEMAEAAGAASASRPLGTVNLDLEQPELNAAVLEFARETPDTIGFNYLLNEAIDRARALLARSDADAEFGDLLDRLICLGATLMQYAQADWFGRVVAAFAAIYKMPAKPEIVERYEYGTQIASTDLAPRVWLAIIERIYGLGALAVREERWHAVRDLTLQPAAGNVDFHKNWLSQAINLASRAQQLDEKVSVLTVARTDVARLDCLRSDGVPPDADELLTALAQFDVLSNVVALDGADARRAAGVYFPNFARFYGHRVAPVIERLISDADMRDQLLGGLGDAELAEALRGMGEYAKQVGWHFDGFTNWPPSVEEFIALNLPPETK